MANMPTRGVGGQDARGDGALTPQHNGTKQRTGQNFNAHNLPILGAGLLGLISSFLPWYGYRFYNGFGRTWHSSMNAWHSGATAWLPIVLMVIAAALAAAHMLAKGRGAGLGSVGAGTAIAVLSAVSLLLIVVRWSTLPHVNGYIDGYRAWSSGARYGLIIGLISSIVMTLFALRRLKASGDTTGRPGYERDGSMAGYSAGGTDRSRALDRERVEAGRRDGGRESGRMDSGRRDANRLDSGQRDTGRGDQPGYPTTPPTSPSGAERARPSGSGDAGHEQGLTGGRDTTGGRDAGYRDTGNGEPGYTEPGYPRGDREAGNQDPGYPSGGRTGRDTAEPGTREHWDER